MKNTKKEKKDWYFLNSYKTEADFKENSAKNLLECVEDVFIAPSVIDKYKIQPTEFKQVCSKKWGIELIFLLSPSKILVLSRSNPTQNIQMYDTMGDILDADMTDVQVEDQPQEPFEVYLAVDYLGVTGMKRKGKMYNSTIDVEDYNYEEDNGYGNPICMADYNEETQLQHRKSPQTRNTPFDADADIIVMPDFISRKVN